MNFSERVQAATGEAMRSSGIESLQANLGRRCNMACKHCHMEAGPRREELMDSRTVGAVLSVLGQGDIGTLDITGGAPELNPHFRRLVIGARELGRSVMVRSNLTVFSEDGLGDLPGFYAEYGVEVFASLPYYSAENVERVRGREVFLKSIEALRTLNGLGYANGSGRLRLTLVYNPMGAFLPPLQEGLEEEFRRQLDSRYGISFDHLFTLANMPIGRFRDFLLHSGRYEGYMAKLSCAFNTETLDGLMCRRLISVAWDGTLYDCDFNLALGLGLAEGLPRHISEFDYNALAGRRIAVSEHCYGCTAGQGST